MSTRGWFLLSVLCWTGCTSNSSSERDDALSSHDAVHPVVDAAHAQLLGASAEHGWLPADSAAGHLEGGETYRLYSLTSFLGEARGAAPEAPRETCTNATVRIGARAESERDVVAVGGAWNAMPRTPVVQGTTLPTYQEAISTLLRDQGIDDPVVNITQILRVDLEGDGMDEVLVSAHRRRGMGTSAAAGDYGVVVLRKVVGGEVRTIPLAEEYYPDECLAECAPAIYRVSAVVDANGDGLMEVMLASQYYEGEGKALYTVDSNGVREVLAWRCGA